MMLERELSELLLSARLSPKQRRGVERRFGWDGRGPTTLAAAGAVEGYSRERIRQLEERVVRHVERTRPRLEVTASALHAIHAAAPAGHGELARVLVRAKIAERPFDPRGVLRAAELAGMTVAVIERDGLVLRNDQVLLASTAIPLVQRLVVRDGAASVAAVAEELAGPRASVRRLLQLRNDVTWLDDEQDWLVVPATRTRVTNALRKMLSLAPSLTLADVADGLGRQRCDVPLPRHILRSLCGAYDWLALDGNADIVSAATRLDPERILSRLERILVGIFRAEGPILGFTRILRLAEAGGMRPTTAGVYLGRSPVFRSVSRGHYVLRGAVV
jgi:hypothetical protein